jgi:transcriptional regulator of arginine metabolism
MTKQERQERIRSILTSNVVETQDQLVQLLNDEGAVVTQATVSRDIKEMSLVKVPIDAGRYRYSMPIARNDAGKGDRVIVSALRSVDVMDKFINLVLTPGSGPAVATLIGQHHDDRIFATVPADASILIIARSETAASELGAELRMVLD